MDSIDGTEHEATRAVWEKRTPAEELRQATTQSISATELEQLEVVLRLKAEAEAQRQQVREHVAPNSGIEKANTALHKEEEASASMLRAELGGVLADEMESHTEHFNAEGLEGLCFEKDWRITELQAAVAAGVVVGNGVVKANVEITEEQFSSVFDGGKVALRDHRVAPEFGRGEMDAFSEQFERDWQITEVLPPKSPTRDWRPTEVLPPKSPIPQLTTAAPKSPATQLVASPVAAINYQQEGIIPSQQQEDELQALQLFLVAANASAGESKADKQLAMARQTVA